MRRMLRLSCVALVTMALCIAMPPAELSDDDDLASRGQTFQELQCKGRFDASKFARLDRLCDDCYHQFNNATVYVLCRQDCFTTLYFKGCVEVLHEEENMELFKKYIIELHGADPSVLG